MRPPVLSLTALKHTEIKKLDVYSNRCDLRMDIHVFIDYVITHKVKRTHRSNNLSKGDAIKLAKLMSNPQASEKVREMGYSSWVDHVDTVALNLGFVTYDTEGEYVGYTSSEPSYPDNYIKIVLKTYNKFLTLPLKDQETFLLKSLVKSDEERKNEFFKRSIFSRLDSFNSWGAGTGVVPTLEFAKIRMFLLQILANCEPGQWLSTASFVAYLKKAHRFFLIPEKFKLAHRGDDKKRYDNFRETKKNVYEQGTIIKESEPDAFERVEGRYVERFLEAVPFEMQYLDIAYDKNLEKELSRQSGYSPVKDKIKAFRIHERLMKAFTANIPEPKVTIQPNFEIHVESESYPASVASVLKPLTDIITQDRVMILRLKKEKVTQALIQNEKLEVSKLLENLSGQPLPQNIAVELEEWSGHSEVFTLYEEGGLFEGDENLPEIEQYVVEQISAKIRLIHSPDKLFTVLEDKEHIPFIVNHSDKTLKTFGKEISTVFTSKTAKKIKPQKKKSVTLMKQTSVCLYFPEQEIFKIFRKKLLDKKCPFNADPINNSITFLDVHQKQVNSVIDSINDETVIHIKDIP